LYCISQSTGFIKIKANGGNKERNNEFLFRILAAHYFSLTTSLFALTKDTWSFAKIVLKFDANN